MSGANGDAEVREGRWLALVIDGADGNGHHLEGAAAAGNGHAAQVVGNGQVGAHAMAEMALLAPPAPAIAPPLPQSLPPMELPPPPEPAIPPPATLPTDPDTVEFVLPWLKSARRRRRFGAALGALGWVALLTGLVVAGAGLIAADAAADEVQADLAVVHGAVIDDEGVLAAAGRALTSADRSLAGLEESVGELEPSLAGLEVALADLLLRDRPASSTDLFASSLPDLQRIAVATDRVLGMLEGMGVSIENRVSMSDAIDAFGEAGLGVAPPPGAAAGFGPILLQYPLPGYPITAAFGICRDGCRRSHGGIDMRAPRATSIQAAAAGVVRRAGWINGSAGYGVVIDHGSGWQTKYFHMVDGNLPVAEGDRVAPGQVIGYVGSTGNSAAYHLHFEIELYDLDIDPERGFRYLEAPAQTAERAVPDDSTGVPPQRGARLEPLGDLLPAVQIGGGELAVARAALAEVSGTLSAAVVEAADVSGRLAALQSDLEMQRARVRYVLGAATAFVLAGLLLVALGRGMRHRRPVWAIPLVSE
jgi:murein DD-endopeptidase MepM/ murein hydrolase activator NlpD